MSGEVTLAELSRKESIAQALYYKLSTDFMESTKVCSLGSITDALFKIRGEYRRNM
jgi:hypothetical protein